MTKREQVRTFLAQLLEQINDTGPFSDSDSLVVSGRLSSLDVVDTLVFLERTFDFVMDPSQFEPAKFDSVDNIVAMLETPARQSA